MSKAIWLRADELSDTVNALELVQYFLTKSITNTYYWKWVIVSLHNSLQGFMVCALKGSNGLNVLKDDIATEWVEAYQSGSGEYPIKILDNYLNLYEKIKSDRMLMFINSKKFNPQGQQGWSIKKLNQWRNKFIHFIPGGWSLEVSGLPKVVRDCIAAIEFLVFESNNIPIEDELMNRIRVLIEKIKEDTDEIETVYGK